MVNPRSLALVVILAAWPIVAAHAAESSSGPTSKLSITEYINGEANLKDVKLVQVFEGTEFKVEWKQSQFGGTFTTRVAGKEDDNKPLETKVLGPSQVMLVAPDGKESSDFLLMTNGSGYCVHPSLYANNSPQYRWKPADKLRNVNIAVEPVPGHSEIIRATGLVLLVRTSGSDLKSIDDSPVFWPGMTWTVSREMTLGIIVDGKHVAIAMKPGTYMLDEHSVPQKVEAK